MNIIYQRICSILFSIRLDRPKLVKILIAGGANVNEWYDGLNSSPLHRAAAFGKKLKIIVHWIRQNLNFRIWFWIGFEGIVAVLLENNANVDVRNANGETPCDVVQDKSKMQNNSTFGSYEKFLSVLELSKFYRSWRNSDSFEMLSSAMDILSYTFL